MDDIDKQLINILQRGFPISERPFHHIAMQLDLPEDDVIERIKRLLADGFLTRFGPLYHAERVGGALTLAAMKVPESRFDDVAKIVNAFPQVAHNYQRDHILNMWFVLATQTPQQIPETLDMISAKTGLKVYDMPKIREYFVELYLPL